MGKAIDSIKHKEETRAHIPSKEEAGYEEASPKVQGGRKVLDLPLNPVTTRGQDPELFWMDKYGNDDREELLKIDIRSLYRHEHIAPERLIRGLYRVVVDDKAQPDLFGNVNEMFGNALEKDELEKVGDYYSHQDGWTNRLIQGDSHLVMASLLEREGMAKQVQMIYIDPPYGIKYGSNWQVKLNNRDVKDGADEALSGEPEVIKAFRDTWELGIHSYLSYIRDRLLIAKELLHDSGSCFIQISDENVHLVRSVMDEVFGSENFMSLISYTKTAPLGAKFLGSSSDFIIWYCKNKEKVKYRKLYKKRVEKTVGGTFNNIELSDGSWRRLTSKEKNEETDLPEGSKRFRAADISRQTQAESAAFTFQIGFEGKSYLPSKGRQWASNKAGMERLSSINRIVSQGNTLAFKKFEDDFDYMAIDNTWGDTSIGSFTEKIYIVQTGELAIQRCVLMTTDPGDLVLDPTCGSGTTAYVAEQFGRRWITTDTSRIALNIAKTRLMTATFPYYHLYSNVAVEYAPDKNGKFKPKIKPLPEAEQKNDIRQGFVYEKVPHITLKSLANDEPPEDETLYDQPYEDKKRLRVCGPFTVETLQNFEPVSPADLDDETRTNEQEGAFEQVIKNHLESVGIKNGRKEEQVDKFVRVELLSHEYLHAEGFYQTPRGESKAYFHLGPKFGTVSKNAVNEAIKECRTRGDANWLVILGFSFESDIQGSQQTTNLGTFEVTKARIHDDLLQEGLKKKPSKSAASFVTIGEPDITPHRDGNTVILEIQGLDIYDPIKDEVKARDLHDINYWMVDDDYDGSNFVVRQVFFCGGEKDEVAKWKKGLSDLAKQTIKTRAEKTLKIELDDEAFDRIYGFSSHPIQVTRNGQKVAVRIVSQFGEESMKVFTLTA
jgi:adenine-specific DNA-methyltransferase